MKKLISIFLITIILVTAMASMSACGKVVECDFCPNEGRENKMHTIDMRGMPIVLCDECYNEFMGFANESK